MALSDQNTAKSHILSFFITIFPFFITIFPDKFSPGFSLILDVS